MAKRRLVVVGNGMAGARAIENVMARGGAALFDIVVFGDERHGNYNRMMLSSILDGSKTPADILLNPPDWYRDNCILFHAGRRVASIDRTAKVVTADDGSQERYDVLLIATGSRPFIPPIEGAHGADGTLKPGLFGYRTLDDCRNIAAAAAQARVAATIGGGLLGLEAARSLMGLGCESHIVHRASHLLDVQLDSIGGHLLEQTMVGLGLHVHTDKATSEILGQEKVEGLLFKDGSRLECDLVVVAAGIRPNAEIGLRAGLAVERAIVVNDHMQSVDDKSIYAVGECAQHRGLVYGLVAPLWDQAKVFADHVTDHDRTAAYHGSKLATKLKVMGVELASMGITEPVEPHDEVVQFTEFKRGTYKKLILRNGRLVGGILMGEISKAAYLMQAFDRNSPLPEDRSALLFDLGGLPPPVDVAAMPADMQVCNCGGVSKEAIGQAVASGCHDLEAVMERTRAGTGCGTCKDQVGDLVAWFGTQAPEPSPDTAIPIVLDEGLTAHLHEDGRLSFGPDGTDGRCTPGLFRRIGELALRVEATGLSFAAPNRIEVVGIREPHLQRIRHANLVPTAASGWEGISTSPSHITLRTAS